VVIDIGRPAEIRYDHEAELLEDRIVTQDDIDYIISKIGEFSGDNRAGIEATLHRISAIRNRRGKIIGLTCRIGRTIIGTIDIVRDVIESGKNILFMGPPGIGKTTKLREAARVLSVDFGKRVIVVDTSNEIAGDGDIPHPGIGYSRRMQVSAPEHQHAVMIEAVENHMPEVIIVDEIGTEAEAQAARTIAERGVQLIGTAHGVILENILNNPTLSDLVGGIQTVILGDEEAKRRKTQKAILERKAPPTFDMAVEIMERDKFAIYFDVASAIDQFLKGAEPQPEIRIRTKEGKIQTIQKAKEPIPEFTQAEEEEAEAKDKGPVRIYPFAVNKRELEREIRTLEVPAVVVDSMDEADIVLTVRNRAKFDSQIVAAAGEHNLPVHAIRKNVSSQIIKFLKFFFKTGGPDVIEEIAVREAEDAVEQVKLTKKGVDLAAQNAYIRRLQHQVVERNGLRSESIGDEPHRRLRIYPA
jgi:stage III sporulation protein SpoIIIAA